MPNDHLDNPVPADAKWAFTTRRIARADVRRFSLDYRAAIAGDLLLGTIERIGQHKKVQLASGRYSESYVGDTVVMAVGDRYAPDQFEGLAEIDAEGVDVIAGGGLVGRVLRSNARMSAPTRVRPRGLLADAAGRPLNVADGALPPARIPSEVHVIGVLGASMNAGKTTAAASLCHGLARAGLRVRAVKATGTGAFGDYNAYLDAGVAVLDFTDAGMASTYRMPLARIEAGFETLVGTAAAAGAEVVVVEIADGVFQPETAALLRASRIRERLDSVLFAAGDALGAAGGVEVLRAHGLEPFAVSGAVTCSPLATREASAAAGVPLVARETLCDPSRVIGLDGVLASRRRDAPGRRDTPSVSRVGSTSRSPRVWHAKTRAAAAEENESIGKRGIPSASGESA